MGSLLKGQKLRQWVGGAKFHLRPNPLMKGFRHPEIHRRRP